MYDDEHMGGHVAIVAHLTNAPSAHTPGGPLSAAAWLPAAAWSGQPDGDAALAVAGGDANISIISVAEARVARLLRGHAREVVELAACAGRPRLLASLGRDGGLRLWDVPSEACLASLQCDATSIVRREGGRMREWRQTPFGGSLRAGAAAGLYTLQPASPQPTLPQQALAPDGSCLITGNAKGKLHRYDVMTKQPEIHVGSVSRSDAQQHPQQQQQQQQPESCCIEEGSRAEVRQAGGGHSDAVDCIRFLPDGRLVTKSTDGRMFVFRLGGNDQQAQQAQQQRLPLVCELVATGGLESLASWKVPSCSGGSGAAARSSFGTTADGRFVAVVSRDSRLLLLPAAP